MRTVKSRYTSRARCGSPMAILWFAYGYSGAVKGEQRTLRLA